MFGFGRRKSGGAPAGSPAGKEKKAGGDLVPVLAALQEQLQRLQGLPPGAPDAFPLLNNVKRAVAGLERDVGALANAEERTVWLQQLSFVAEEVGAVEKKVLGQAAPPTPGALTERPARPGPAPGGLFDGMALASTAPPPLPAPAVEPGPGGGGALIPEGMFTAAPPRAPAANRPANPAGAAPASLFGGMTLEGPGPAAKAPEPPKPKAAPIVRRTPGALPVASGARKKKKSRIVVGGARRGSEPPSEDTDGALGQMEVAAPSGGSPAAAGGVGGGAATDFQASESEMSLASGSVASPSAEEPSAVLLPHTADPVGGPDGAGVPTPEPAESPNPTPLTASPLREGGCAPSEEAEGAEAAPPEAPVPEAVAGPEAEVLAQVAGPDVPTAEVPVLGMEGLPAEPKAGAPAENGAHEAELRTGADPGTSLGESLQEPPASVPAVAAEACEGAPTAAEPAGGGEEADGSDVSALVDRNKRKVLLKLQTQSSELLALQKAYKETVRGRRVLLAQQAAANAKVDALEAEQTRAVEAEDYERADELTGAIEAAANAAACTKDDLKGVESLCAEREAELGACELQMLELQQEEFAGLTAIAATLAAEKKAAAAQKAKLAEQESEWEALALEDLDADGSKLEAQTKVLAEQDKDLQGKIAELTAPVDQANAALVEKAAGIRRELEDLERAAAAKRAELGAVDGKIAANEAERAKLSSRFQRQIDRLEAEREDLVELEAKCARGEEALAAKKVEYRETAATLEREMGRLDEDHALVMAAAAEVEVSLLQRREAASSQAAARVRVQDLLAEEQGIDVQVRDMQREEETGQAALGALQGRLAALREEASQVEADNELAQKRVPELESQKKAAVASKNFKEAARINAEIKEWARRTSGRGSAGGFATEIAELEGKIAAAAEEQHALAEAIGMAVQECKAIQGERALLVRTRLRAEIDRAASLEDFDEAAELQTELDSVVAQRASIADFLGLPADFTAADLSDWKAARD